MNLLRSVAFSLSVAILGACPRASVPAPVDVVAAPPAAEVTILGVRSTVISQHMIDAVYGKEAMYFVPEGGSEIVVYVAKQPDCPGLMSVTGRPLTVSGPGKSERPGQDHVEDQFDATSVECTAYATAYSSPEAKACFERLPKAGPVDPNGCPPCPCACNERGEMVCAPCAVCDEDLIRGKGPEAVP